MKSYDIIVIGAGPIGSYTAYRLATQGYHVGLFEKKKRAGSDVICAGVISTQAFKRYELPYDSILTKINSFTFVSPQNSRLEYSQEEPLAYTVDRQIFDRELFIMAKTSGVEMHTGEDHAVERVQESTQCCSVATRNKMTYQARIVCIATGNNYRLQSMLGFGKPVKILHGYQVEIPLELPSHSTAFIHVGRDVAPGSFGWVFPISPIKARAGVLVEQNSVRWLNNLLMRRICLESVAGSKSRTVPKSKRRQKRISPGSDLNIQSKSIAHGPIKKTATRRILVVGEAAGQVKTTTGGGVHFGLLCSEIAVDKIIKTMRDKSHENMLDYETTWRSTLVSELGVGTKLRKIAASISDNQLEELFAFAKKNKFWIQLLTPRINFDYHSNMLDFCLSTFRYVLKLRK